MVDSFKVDQKHLKAYNEVCGFKNNGYIPAIYLTVLSQSLQMHMMTSEAFPFPILGLVHIRNQVKQYRKVGVNETLTLSCKFGELQPHDKGVQFDFITTVKVGNEVVVEALTTYLSRQKTDVKAAVKPAESKAPDYKLNTEWKISENTGRRYAMTSGDFNLIHIHAVTAKALVLNRRLHMVCGAKPKRWLICHCRMRMKPMSGLSCRCTYPLKLSS